MTASNLFKYCQPCHGLVLFKHHQPLEFSLPQLADLLLCARSWFWAVHSAHPAAAHPFFLWNCGARAGASQFHGHAQVTLSEVRDPSRNPSLQLWQQQDYLLVCIAQVSDAKRIALADVPGGSAGAIPWVR